MKALWFEMEMLYIVVMSGTTVSLAAVLSIPSQQPCLPTMAFPVPTTPSLRGSYVLGLRPR